MCDIGLYFAPLSSPAWRPASACSSLAIGRGCGTSWVRFRRHLRWTARRPKSPRASCRRSSRPREPPMRAPLRRAFAHPRAAIGAATWGVWAKDVAGGKSHAMVGVRGIARELRVCFKRSRIQNFTRRSKFLVSGSSFCGHVALHHHNDPLVRASGAACQNTMLDICRLLLSLLRCCLIGSALYQRFREGCNSSGCCTHAYAGPVLIDLVSAASVVTGHDVWRQGVAFCCAWRILRAATRMSVARAT